MKLKIAAVAALSLASITSSAAPRNWTQMSKTSESAIYADMGNIIRTGTVIRYWVLLDVTSGKQPRSIVMRNEVNCEVMEWRRVYIAGYDDQMGKGNEKEYVKTDAQWRPAKPEDPIVLAFPLCEAFKQLDQESAQSSERK